MKFLDDTRIPNHPYPELREVLKIFVANIKAELAENLIGIYLVGSLASGGFDLDSDVDFLVVINSKLSEKNIRSLQDIQIKVHDIDCYPAKHLEGAYISISNLNNWSTVGEKNYIILIMAAPRLNSQFMITNGMFVGFLESVELH